MALVASFSLLMAAAGGWSSRRWLSLAGTLTFGLIALLTHYWALAELLDDEVWLDDVLVTVGRPPLAGAWLVALAYAACGLAAVLGGRSSWARRLAGASR